MSKKEALRSQIKQLIHIPRFPFPPPSFRQHHFLCKLGMGIPSQKLENLLVEVSKSIKIAQASDHENNMI